MHWMIRKFLKQNEEGGAASTSGGAPAPAEPQGAVGVEGGGVDWEGLNDGVEPGNDDGGHDDGDGQHVHTPEVPPVGEGAGTPVAAQPPAATPDGTETDPEPQPDPNAEPEIQPVEAPPELTPEQMEARKQQYQEWRAAEETRLEAQYQFSEDEVAALQTEPERVLPKMAAKLFMDVQEAAVRSIVQVLPQIVGQVNTTQSRDQQASQVFLEANADLADPKFKADIMEQAVAFRKKYPKATPQEAIKGIGRMVRALHGMPNPAAEGTPTPAPAPAPAGRKPAAPPKPHKPAMAGAAPAAKPAAPPVNVWADLAGDDD